MCGINGIAYSPNSGRQVSEAKLIAMRDILHHRGPDDGGVFVSGNIGLGHRRLSIVDVEGGAQPMSSTWSRTWMPQARSRASLCRRSSVS